MRRILLPEVGNFVKNVTHDISQKIPSRESLKSILLSSTRNIRSSIIRGGGKRKIKPKQKRKNIKKPTTKKKKSNFGMKHKDVFSSGDYELLEISRNRNKM